MARFVAPNNNKNVMHGRTDGRTLYSGSELGTSRSPESISYLTVSIRESTFVNGRRLAQREQARPPIITRSLLVPQSISYVGTIQEEKTLRSLTHSSPLTRRQAESCHRPFSRLDSRLARDGLGIRFELGDGRLGTLVAAAAPADQAEKDKQHDDRTTRDDRDHPCARTREREVETRWMQCRRAALIRRSMCPRAQGSSACSSQWRHSFTQ